MQAAITRFFEEDVLQFTNALAQLESEIPSEASVKPDELLQRLTDVIETSRDACAVLEQKIGNNDELLKETQDRFRDTIQQWFNQSWFLDRAKNKPRGYPGDYETLIGIYDDTPKATGFSGYLDLYFLNTTLAMAVKARLKAAREFLIHEVDQRLQTLSFLNVACGPCREYTHGWETNGQEVSVTCMDMDREALGYVDEQVGSIAPAGLDFNTKTYNALRMSSADNNVKHFGRPDVIYSIGLCDYIPDNYMIRILKGWRETLAAEGLVYVAFKDCNVYDKTEYAWHVDWHFVARTEDDCRNLFAEAGYDMHDLEMNRCESPVIMNFVCRMPETAAMLDTDEVAVDVNVVAT